MNARITETPSWGRIAVPAAINEDKRRSVKELCGAIEQGEGPEEAIPIAGT